MKFYWLSFCERLSLRFVEKQGYYKIKIWNKIVEDFVPCVYTVALMKEKIELVDFDYDDLSNR